MENNTQIVIIDDDTQIKTRPLYFELIKRYGESNITWKENPEEGLVFVKDNLGKKIIILLDYEFGSKTAKGFSYFKKLQAESSLLYIILYTAKATSIPREELKTFINDHLMAIVDKTDDGYKVALREIEKAINNLSNRVDCVLEEWIIRHERFKQKTPFMKDEKGNSYNMREILKEIRQQTDFGREMSKSITQTAITILQSEINKKS